MINEYQQQALDFLTETNTKMTIRFVGKEANKLWNDTQPRNKYNITLENKRGIYTFDFWDSMHNTNMDNTTLEEFATKYYRKAFYKLSFDQINKANRDLKLKIKEAKPTEYDILTCLQKYDVGTMQNFMDDFGYEIKSTKDIFNFMTTYNAVVEEYDNVCRLFTPDQMEKLQEIQ